MSEISKIVGERLRAYRLQERLSQETVAELAGVHPTYIGQLERGEKNATLESTEKVCRALKLPMSKLFERLPSGEADIAAQCYQLIVARPLREQEQLLHVLKEVVKLCKP